MIEAAACACDCESSGHCMMDAVRPEYEILPAGSPSEKNGRPRPAMGSGTSTSAPRGAFTGRIARTATKTGRGTTGKAVRGFGEPDKDHSSRSCGKSNVGVSYVVTALVI